MYPDKMQDFNNVSMSRNTVVQHIEDLSDKACAFDFYSFAFDESTDATDTALLLIFLQGIDNFCITEELLDVSSLKCTTTDMFEAVSDSIDKMGLQWEKLCGVTTAVKNIVGIHVKLL